MSSESRRDIQNGRKRVSQLRFPGGNASNQPTNGSSHTIWRPKESGLKNSWPISRYRVPLIPRCARPCFAGSWNGSKIILRL